MMNLLVKPKPRRHCDHVRARRAAFVAAGNHVFGHESGAGRGAGDVHAGRIATTDARCNFRAAQRRRQAQLVAAGHEDAVGLVDVVEVLAVLAVLARLERQHLACRTPSLRNSFS